jgi:hypothetical protein
MPLQKILFKPGVNRENTRYTTEGGWYECDKVRFRQGNPEVIGGWTRYSTFTYQGVCRSLWNWITLGGLNLIGVGTNLKFYINQGGAYYDVTPIRATSTINNNPFALTASTTATVTDTAHGCVTGDFVTFSGAVNIGGGGTNVTAAVLNQEFQVTVIDANTYTILLSVVPNATAISASPGGGASVVAAYQLTTGPEIEAAITGWGAGGWGTGVWGTGTASPVPLQAWNQYNYGEDLLFGPRGGGLYYWTAAAGVTTRGVNLNTTGGTVTITIASPAVVTLTNVLPLGTAVKFGTTGALPTGITAGTTYYIYNPSIDGYVVQLQDANGNVVNTTGSQSGVQSISVLVDVPLFQNWIVVSDTSRFVLAFGTNDYGASTIDPMLIRWSDQNNLRAWTPNITNQAGSVRLSHGSEIVTAIQTRQEIVTFTDQAVYSLQYLGPPYVWGTQLLGDNISIISPNAVALASGVVYWMGVDKFYMYDGRVQTLNCDLRRFVFQDINQNQHLQVFSGTNEGFNEVWWFYCSANADAVDRYVIYNYAEKIWYYGTLARTAWLDSGLLDSPLAATYINNLVNQENGVDDNATATTAPLDAYISSSEFDIGDGHNFGYIWRVLPDLTFGDSVTSPTGATPRVAMTLYPLSNSGSGAGTPGVDTVIKGNTYDITEEFTGIVYTRVRGRQLIFKMSSNQIGTTWQLGAPRIDIRPDGRR